MNSISFVLPCRNERESLRKVIKDIKNTCNKAGIFEYEIIVSDSSWDGSDKIAKEEDVVLIKHDTEGYGFAIREGAKHAKKDIIIFADPDGTYDFKEFPKLLKGLEENDIVFGNRLKGDIEKGAMPLTHRFIGTPVINSFLKILFGIEITDSQSGYRVLKTKTFRDLNLATNGMEFASEMIIQASKQNLSMTEIPISYRQRGGDSKLRPYRDGFAHIKYIILKTHFYLYALIGGLITLLGLNSLLFGDYFGGFLNSATMQIIFPILGVQIIFLGLFSKTYLYTKFNQENKFLKKFYSIFKLKHAFIIGFLMLGIPLILKLLGLGDLYFDLLLVSVITGIQIIFNSLYLSQLSIE